MNRRTMQDKMVQVTPMQLSYLKRLSKNNISLNGYMYCLFWALCYFPSFIKAVTFC